MAGTAERYLRPEVLAGVKRLDLKARFIVEGFIAGLHRSPYQGFSVEFSEHRKYSPGDDLRTIDWGVYAKTDRFFIKKFRAETNLDAWLLVDRSASMAFGSPGLMTKMDYAISLAASLGFLMIRQQDSVGLAIGDEQLRTFLPPRARRSHLMRILSELTAVAPAGRTNLAACLHQVADRVRKKGLVVVFSDLLCDPGPVLEAMHHLRFRGHDLIVFQVLDHAEATFPFDGPTRFVDPETGDHVDADARAYRDAYLEQIRGFIEHYRTEIHKVRGDFQQVDTSMGFDKALVEYLVGRKGRF